MVTSATQATVYEPVPGWPAIPHPMSFKEATSVAVDRQDRVYVFNRGDNPMMIFDRDGFVRGYMGRRSVPARSRSLRGPPTATYSW